MSPRLSAFNEDFVPETILDQMEEQPEEALCINPKIQWAKGCLEEGEPLDYVIDPLIIHNSVVAVIGMFGSKKTWAMIDMGVCVAGGKTWLGMKVNQCPVLFIDEESGKKRFKRRLAKIIRGEMLDDNIPFAFTNLEGFNLRIKANENKLAAYIHQVKAGLVIIDALADIMPGGDENAVKDTQPVFMALRKIAEDTGACIIVIHHCNKQNTYRGSTAIPGAVNFMITVDSKQDSDVIQFGTEKNQDNAPTSFAAKVHMEEDKFWLTPTQAKSGGPKFGKAQNYVLRFLAESGPSKVTDIENHADSCTPKSARVAVYNLADLKLVHRVDDAPDWNGAMYDLTDKGREAVCL